MRAKFAHKTKTELETLNPVLLDGEVVFEKDTRNLKIGDGSTAYKSIPYYGGGSFPSIGSFYICGIVYYVDIERKLVYVAATQKIVQKPCFINIGNLSIHANDLSWNSGLINSQTIKNYSEETDVAVKYCFYLDNFGFSDWFLPTLFNEQMKKNFASICPSGAYWTSLFGQGNKPHSISVEERMVDFYGETDPGNELSVVPCRIFNLN